jgi:hypothetical protein
MRESFVLYGDEKVLGEWPFDVHPLLNALEAGAFSHFCGFIPPKLMTTLRPNGLIAQECEVCPFDADSLGFSGAKMHLNSAFAGVVEGNVLKSG